jgi:drug/metabolite transporter (DMT)-like permease
MAAAGIAFTFMTVLIRPAAEELHSLQIVFLRNLLGVVIMLPFVARGIELRLWRSPNIRLHLLRAVVTAVAMACWFTAIPHVALSEAVALNFTAPMFVTVLAALLLKETVRARRISALAVGFVGVLIVVRPGFSELHFGQVLILIDAVFWGVAIILVRILSRTDSPQTIVAYMFILVLPISAVPAAFVWTSPSITACGLMAGIALMSTVGHYCATKAFTVAEASAVMPFDYMRLIWFTAAGFLAFGEVPDRWTLAGGAVIAGSSLYLLMREHALARRRQLHNST